MPKKEKRVQWRTRTKGKGGQIGSHFILPKGDKSNLPHNLRVVSVPEYSELSLRDKIKESESEAEKKVKEYLDKPLEPEESSESKGFTDEEIREAGLDEIEELGIPKENVNVTSNDEITVTIPHKIKRKSSSSDSKEEFDWKTAHERWHNFKKGKLGAGSPI